MALSLIPFSSQCFPYLPDEPYGPYTVCFMMGIDAHVFNTLRCTLQTVSDEDLCVVSCLMKCQSEQTCISFISLSVLKALRTLEAMKQQEILQNKPWSPCLVVYKSDSN